MISNREYFSKIFRHSPELLAFLGENVDASQDYTATTAAPWAHEMYQSAALELKQVKESKKIDFLNSYLKENVHYSYRGEPSEGESKTEEVKSVMPVKDRRIELERTILSIMILYAIRDNNHDFFEKNPAIGKKPITKDQLMQLAQLFKENFPTDKEVDLVLAKLVLGDLGKIAPLRDEISKVLGLHHKDPDKFLSEMLSQKFGALASVLPCINQLGDTQFFELCAMSPDIHYGHFAQAESSPIKLKSLQDNIREHGVGCLFRSMMVQILDVGGAAAQSGGQILLNQAVAETYIDYILSSLMQLDTQSLDFVYDHYLNVRLKICGIDKNKMTGEESFFLARIICMFRVYEKDKAIEFQNSFKMLQSNPDFMRNIKIILDYERLPSHETPTYIPALLAGIISDKNIMQLAFPDEKNSQAVALRIGMEIIANALRIHEKLIRKNKLSKMNPVNFNFLTGLIKSDFSLINGLCKRDGICFDEHTSSIYPTSWVMRNKGKSIQNYVCEHGKLRKFSSIRKGVFLTFAFGAIFVGHQILKDRKNNP